VQHELAVWPSAGAAARAAARHLADRLRAAVAARGAGQVAVSRGRSPGVMFDALSREDVPWERVVVYQVDERVAPDGGPERNLTALRHHLAPLGVEVVAMPVDEPDLAGAAARYAARLPARFDAVHLGLGADGHTASLVPGDPVLDELERPVAVTGPYQGRPRMTLTYAGIGRAAELVWLVTGADKRAALRRLRAGDRSIPAGRVEAPRSIIVADTAAAPA
jgi:6-phosphogluconolactonase/glucosamine-6-phosphate isomerase/deaminase